MAKFDTNKEKVFLNSLVAGYADQSPYSKVKKDIINNLIGKYTCDRKSKSVLQMGCSNGYETNYLVENFMKVDVVDGASRFIELLKDKYGSRVRFIDSLFEEFDSKGQKYDYIFCNYVLEHVVDVRCVLLNIKKYLTNDGMVIAVVPNANAFSRQLAQKMGLIEDIYGLTMNDVAHGHRRVYDHGSLIDDFNAAGFVIVHSEGVILKILADFQLNDMLDKCIISEAHVWGLQQMADGRIDLCDSIFVVAKGERG